MKRTILFIIGMLLLVPVCIASTEEAVTMVSYEQGWLDDMGTLALKNNTNEEIHNVVFQITYLDMSGKALDYEEYKKSVSIAPGMTRKIDIPAYEKDRHYHYYKSENMSGGSPSFKVEYKLLDYNIKEEAKPDDDLYGDYRYYEGEDHDQDITFGWMYILLAVIAAFVVIGISVGLYVLVAVLAQQRHRSVVLWVLLSIIGSPLLMIIILLCIGDSQRDSF